MERLQLYFSFSTWKVVHVAFLADMISCLQDEKVPSFQMIVGSQFFLLQVVHSRKVVIILHTYFFWVNEVNVENLMHNFAILLWSMVESDLLLFLTHGFLSKSVIFEFQTSPASKPASSGKGRYQKRRCGCAEDIWDDNVKYSVVPTNTSPIFSGLSFALCGNINVDFVLYRFLI